MTEPRSLRLQRAMATLILGGDEAVMAIDPARVARRLELSATDQCAFRDQAEALMTYRELARTNLIEPLETMFPVLKSLLENAQAWDPCIQAFLDAKVIRSSQYRDIAPAFLDWLAATSWGQDRWPFLLELAHAEILEVLVARFPDSDPPGNIHPDPGPDDFVVLDPATQVVTYRHAVHLVQEAAPIPEARPTHLLAFRNREGDAKLLELTAATSALIVQGRVRTLSAAAAALDMPDLAPALTLFRKLQRDGAIAGFLTPS
jgi:hypothetical protein